MAAEIRAKDADLTMKDLADFPATPAADVATALHQVAAPDLSPSSSRAPDLLLREKLSDDPCSFEFVQAVTLLQRLRAPMYPVGGFFNPDEEAVRFEVNPRLAFPASEIQKLKMGDGPAQLTVNFMGLTGPSGVLPHAYSELILARARDKDHTLRAFFDIFNHRAISLFYRAWRKFQFPVTFGTESGDLFSQYLHDLVGLGTAGLRDRQDIEDEALLHYLSLVAMQTRSATALEQILVDYFEVPIEIQDFTGSWYQLDLQTQCEMIDEDSASRQLGAGAVVGDAAWDRQGRVRIRIGPMSMDRYLDFLPEGSAYRALRAITQFFSNQSLDFEAQLVLKGSEVPEIAMDFDARHPARLGWVSWARTAPGGYPAAMEKARDLVDKAAAEFETTRLDFENARALYNDSQIGKPDFALKKAVYDASATMLEQLRSELRILTADPDDTILTL